jgi:hypothetical protein
MVEKNDETESHKSDQSRNAAASSTKWFGASLAVATNNSPLIPTDPFPLNLRQVIDPHIEKARINRRDALNAIRCATGEDVCERTMERFRDGMAAERDFQLSCQTLQPLLDALFESTNLPCDTDLSLLHKLPDKNAKDRLLYDLTRNPGPFHQAYDDFVRNDCAPRFAALAGDDCTEIYYQSFPCLRIVQPNEFSIGPHADVAYGHHPCSVNFYVPLTRIGGASSLFLETRPGAEDWHSLEGNLGEFATKLE